MAQFDDFAKILKEAGKDAAEIEKILKSLREEAKKTAEELEEELESLKIKLSLAKSIVEQQELQRDIQEKLLWIKQ